MKKTPIILLLTLSSILSGEDIKTLDGVEYTNVTNLSAQPDCLKFYTEDGPKSVDFLVLDNDLRKKYHYDALSAGIARGMASKPGILKKTDGYNIGSLDQAVEKAGAENKLIGFMMMWDQFYNKLASPLDKGGNASALHFFNSFKDSMVIVFVAHESELDKVPESVKKGFGGPDEGGFAPNMCVVSSDLKDFIVEIPLGGADSNGKIREKIFQDKLPVVQKYLAENGGSLKK